MKRLLAVAAAVLVTLPAAAAAQNPEPEGGNSGRDNVASAIATHDGADVFRLAFAIDRTIGETLDSGNAAVAYTSCESCKATAIAVQVVLAMNEPSTVKPQNWAMAITQNCTSCESVALAYQIVVGVDGPVHFTPEGSREIARIQQALRDLDDSDLSPQEKEAQADVLVEELKGVIEEELVKAGKPGTVEIIKDRDEKKGDDASPSPDGSPAASPGDGTATTPSATASPAATQSASPSPTGSSS